VSALEVDVTEGDVVIRPMLTINQAIDLFAGDFTRRGCSDKARYTYTRILGLFANRLPVDADVSKITSDDCRRFLDLYNRHAPGTQAHTFDVLASFFKWLVFTEQVKRNPLATIRRPRKTRPDDLDVVTVSTDDVRKLLAAAEGWTERLTIGVAVYAGARRHALSQLRISDFDRAEGRIRFREKGGKIIWKPVPDVLANLIEAAIAGGVYAESLVLLADADRSGDPYLIPPEAKLQKVERDDRTIWRVVKRVADRAGVATHVHALRAAFAVLVLEQFEQPYMAQQLLGHVNPQTTQVYLRKLDKQTVMEPVRGLSWDPNPGGDDGELQGQFAGGRAGGHRRSEREAGQVSPDGDGLGVSAGGQDRLEVAALVAEIADLRSRLAAYEAVQPVQSSSAVVGAGGFEPPKSDTSLPERPGGTDLVGILTGEARSTSEQTTEVDA
jgi:integrase